MFACCFCLFWFARVVVGVGLVVVNAKVDVSVYVDDAVVAVGVGVCRLRCWWCCCRCC